jgi:Holliday junction resolvasome RuvABC endonuclease subunit
MIVVGIDPGPTNSGLIVYEVENWPHDIGRVVHSSKDATLDEVREAIDHYSTIPKSQVVVECTQAGPPSTAVVKTTEVVGRIMERCHVYGIPCETYYRRDVLQALNCARKGNKDSFVRMACIELHGGDKATAVGNKKNPGPLYGVSSHAWQALGVVCTHVFHWHQNEGAR